MRGVSDLRIDTRACEIVVTRTPGSASNTLLLRTLEKTGYPGTLIPMQETKLRLQGVRSQACAQRLQSCLRRVRGVRNVSLSGTRYASITYDSRCTNTAGLIRAARRVGVEARVEN